MIHFFGNVDSKVFALQTSDELSTETISKLTWLFGNAPKINTASLDAFFNKWKNEPWDMDVQSCRKKAFVGE